MLIRLLNFKEITNMNETINCRQKLGHKFNIIAENKYLLTLAVTYKFNRSNRSTLDSRFAGYQEPSKHSTTHTPVAKTVIWHSLTKRCEGGALARQSKLINQSIV